ncbi:GDP-fucose transporter, variant [Loa loa]|uniref:GDP-fucose transporter, variant n=1 Tax=Loa loa TaxID=7209 RepID=A0A1S0UJ11_LOALO|nr:GDP-fucose transporter, variant [Loa loa]EJD75441.1 GDP-fucose transporter, variant [Loa loa]
MKNGHKHELLMQKYVKIFVVVFLYWFCSIGLVFLNKYLLSSESLKLNAPLFVTWYQCFVTVLLCCVFCWVSKQYPSLVTFPFVGFDHRISREVLPLSFVFVAMIATNNLCLKYVGVSFYYIGRSLTTVFNVICSYIILGQLTSLKTILCCALIIGGFVLGVDQEDATGTLSVTGVIFGVAASMFVALNAIYTQRTLPSVGDSITQLTLYNNINALVLFIPVMLFSGDISEVFYFRYSSSLRFWTLMTLSGIFGFLMSYVTGWQIQVTSSLTHNISGTAKAAAQTVIAVVWWQEMKSLLWWISNVIVLGGSAIYTMIKRKEMVDKYDTNKSKLNENIERQAVLFGLSDEDETV